PRSFPLTTAALSLYPQPWKPRLVTRASAAVEEVMDERRRRQRRLFTFSPSPGPRSSITSPNSFPSLSIAFTRSRNFCASMRSASGGRCKRWQSGITVPSSLRRILFPSSRSNSPAS
ncbi:unnamed protein product, partial [Musa hybrid cultivar]